MAAKKKNAETVEAAAPSVIAVDARKLSHPQPRPAGKCV